MQYTTCLLYTSNINSYVRVGETIKAKVLSIDEESYHLKLSIKNINYKVVKKKRLKIIETPSGFKPLKNRLNGWINDKYKEIMKKNEKKD